MNRQTDPSCSTATAAKYDILFLLTQQSHDSASLLLGGFWLILQGKKRGGARMEATRRGFVYKNPEAVIAHMSTV